MAKKQADGEDTNLNLDRFAEDLFGLNIRGLRSIFALWVHPRKYFTVARTPDWNGLFTPSVRLWLSFFALFSALKFWWIGGNEGMIGAFTSGFAQAGLPIPDGTTYEDVGREAVMWIFSLTPILQIICMFLLALIFPFWGEQTTISLKQRYLFAVIVPSASLMPLFMTIMLFVPQSALSLYGLLIAAVTFLVDFQTGYRGAFTQVTRMGRAWRAGLLALIVVLLNTGTSILAQIAGIIVISQKYWAVPTG